MKEIREIKSNIYKIAAVTDRGQRLNKLISPMYEEKANEMDELIEAPVSYTHLTLPTNTPV